MSKNLNPNNNMYLLEWSSSWIEAVARHFSEDTSACENGRSVGIVNGIPG